MNYTPIAKQNIRNIILFYVVIFISFFFYYALSGYRDYTPSYMIGLQLYYAVAYLSMCLLSINSRISNSVLYWSVFLYSLVSSAIGRFVSWNYMDIPFLGAGDSVTYDVWGALSIFQNLSFSEYIDYISSEFNIGVDDWGMPTIIYILYRAFDNQLWGQNALLLLNAITITMYSIMLGRIMVLFNTQEIVRRFCMIAFACFPFLSLTATVGLKENFFVFIILLTYYYLIKYKCTGLKYYLFMAFLSSSLALFFRTAIFAMLIIVIGVSVMFDKHSERKRNLFILISSAIIGSLALDIILSVLYGKGMESILATTDYRGQEMNSTMGGAGQWIINSLSAFCGPFPNFSRAGQYTIVHSSGLVMKLLLNSFMIVGLITIIKNYNNKRYDLLIYFTMNFAMLVLAGVALDMRYQITLFPLMIPIIALTIQNYDNWKLFCVYNIFIIIVVFFYNNR